MRIVLEAKEEEEVADAGCASLESLVVVGGCANLVGGRLEEAKEESRSLRRRHHRPAVD